MSSMDCILEAQKSDFWDNYDMDEKTKPDQDPFWNAELYAVEDDDEPFHESAEQAIYDWMGWLESDPGGGVTVGGYRTGPDGMLERFCERVFTAVEVAEIMGDEK